MADANSTHTCDTCGKEYKRKLNKDGSIRKTKFSFCSPQCRNNPELPRGIRKCARCGKEFEAGPQQIHCSKMCREGTSMNRAEYIASKKAESKYKYTCLCCGAEYTRKPGGTNRKYGCVSRYCSMECRVRHSALLREQRESLDAIRLAEENLSYLPVKKEIQAIRRLGKSKYKPTKKRCNCKKCGAEFIASIGGGLYKQYCDDCLKETKQRLHRIYKAKRRAICKGVHAESVNPFKVFDRDRWHCKLCGCKTPKSKRGTYADDAPELDHIVPISKGGQHTYLNTQCACRKCNQIKSDRPLGQMLLIG